MSNMAHSSEEMTVASFVPLDSCRKEPSWFMFTSFVTHAYQMRLLNTANEMQKIK